MNIRSRKFILVFGAFFVTILMFSSATAVIADLDKTIETNDLEENEVALNEETKGNTFLMTSINTDGTDGVFWCKAPLMRFWFLLYHGPWQITIHSGGSIDIGGNTYHGPVTVNMPFFIGMAHCDGKNTINFIHGIGFGVSVN